MSINLLDCQSTDIYIYICNFNYEKISKMNSSLIKSLTCWYCDNQLPMCRKNTANPTKFVGGHTRAWIIPYEPINVGAVKLEVKMSMKIDCKTFGTWILLSDLTIM